MAVKGKAVLVVEDDIDLCNSVMRMLSQSGYAPTGVTTAREAMHKIKNQKYACILIDIQLGVDSGEEVIEYIRTRPDTENRSSPIVVISGHLDKPLLQKIATHIQGALVKPFDSARLLEIVGKMAQ